MYGLKYLCQILINYQGKNSNLTVEKSGRDHIIQVIHVNILSNGTNGNHVTSDWMQWKEHNLHLAKDASPESKLEGTSEEHKLREGHQKNCSVIF